MIGEKKIRKRETENDNTIWALQLPHEIVFYEQNTAKNCFYHVSKDSMLNRLTTSNANKLPPPFRLANCATVCFYFLQTKHRKRWLLQCVQRFNTKSTNNFKREQTYTSIAISACLRRSPWRLSPWCMLQCWLVLESFCAVPYSIVWPHNECL